MPSSPPTSSAGGTERVDDLFVTHDALAVAELVRRRKLGARELLDATMARLRTEAARLDALAQSAGWKLVGGTELFRLYDTPDATATQDRLARHQIWTRRFSYSDRWLRLGLPGSQSEWNRLARALRD